MAQLVTKLELSISCRKLADLDLLSKSDPQVFVRVQANGQWTDVGHTEWQKDQLNPQFTTTIPVDYRFEEVQPIEFTVVDVDEPGKGVAHQQLIGKCSTTVSAIVGARGQAKELRVKNGDKSRGWLVAAAEEVNAAAANAVVHLELAANKLDKKDFMGKSDPFVTIKRLQPNADGLTDSDWALVWKSEVVKQNLDPTWRPVTLPLQKLCGGDMTRMLRIEVADWDRDGSSDFIGSFDANVDQLLKSVEWPLINKKKQEKKKAKYKDSGTLVIRRCELETMPTFMDFLRGGLQLSLSCSIDFTGSNGNPSDPSSLHHLSQTPNEYANAILAVGSILQNYDVDQMFPAFGFGAKLPDGSVSHCFALSGQPDPHVHGVNGILQAYHQAVHTVTLYGPTNFAPTLRQLQQVATQSRPGIDYHILLILTDGAITDVDETVAAIVDLSILPVSIIIVGVGGANFDTMEVLDADDGVLRSRAGKAAQRDIVQFVPFRRYAHNPAALAAEVLREVPGQVVAHMHAMKVKPAPPVQAACRTRDPNAASPMPSPRSGQANVDEFGNPVFVAPPAPQQ